MLELLLNFPLIKTNKFQGEAENLSNFIYYVHACLFNNAKVRAFVLSVKHNFIPKMMIKFLCFVRRKNRLTNQKKER